MGNYKNNSYGLFSSNSTALPTTPGTVTVVQACSCTPINLCVFGSPITTAGMFCFCNLAVEINGSGTCSTYRMCVNNVASGNCSASLAGTLNCATANFAFIGGGKCNVSSTAYGTISGGYCNKITPNQDYSTIGGGLCNTISGYSSVISGGEFNTISNYWSAIGGGTNNTICGNASFIGSGGSNTTCSAYGFIGSGSNNIASSEHNHILGGLRNCTFNKHSTISGGYENATCGFYTFIGNGCQNKANCCYSTVVNGFCNIVCSCNGVIVGGGNNIVCGVFSGILGGCANNTCNYDCSFIVGTGICANSACTTFVNNLNINTTPTCVTSGDQILVRNSSTGLVNYRTANSIASATYYGSFFDTTCQTATANTATPMKLNSCDTSALSGFTIANNASGNPTRITATNTGVYNLAFSGQFDRTAGGTQETIDIWIAVNGTPVPNSNTHVSIAGNATYIVAAWNFFVALNATQYVELYWATTSSNIRLLTETASAIHPATPSLIATINQL